MHATNRPVVAYPERNPPASPRIRPNPVRVPVSYRTFSRGWAFRPYLSAILPGTEIPAYGLLARHRRRRPYIFSEAEIETLTAAATTAPPRDGLRPTMLATLLGLLASTGLRIGEAIRLTMDDVRLDDRPAHLRVLESKFRKSRLVPVDPTTAAALAGYVRRRRDLGYHALSESFFVNEHAAPLDAGALGCWFRKLTSQAGLRPIHEDARRASLHSFRHSFAVRRLRAWHEAGLNVQALLPTLSVYLGHVRPEDTYWYLTATPDLLQAAGSRFTPDGVVGGAP